MNNGPSAPTFARPLGPDDLDDLEALDKAYAERFGLERVVTRSSVGFYVRTGHAFVAVRAGVAVGFVFAQAVWNGLRPTVFVDRLGAVDGDDAAAYEALLEAVTKSAYDAAVYDLRVLVPEGDVGAAAALGVKQYGGRSERLYARTLGSRGQT